MNTQTQNEFLKYLDELMEEDLTKMEETKDRDELILYNKLFFRTLKIRQHLISEIQIESLKNSFKN